MIFTITLVQRSHRPLLLYYFHPLDLMMVFVVCSAAQLVQTAWSSVLQGQCDSGGGRPTYPHLLPTPASLKVTLVQWACPISPRDADVKLLATLSRRDSWCHRQKIPSTETFIIFVRRGVKKRKKRKEYRKKKPYWTKIRWKGEGQTEWRCVRLQPCPSPSRDVGSTQRHPGLSSSVQSCLFEPLRRQAGAAPAGGKMLQ